MEARHDQRERESIRLALIEGENSGRSDRSVMDIARQSKRKLSVRKYQLSHRSRWRPHGVLRVFVRNSSLSMPPFRPTELTDAETRDIDYLAVSRRRSI
jgi:hypothetical protein